ncbi:MAG: transglutaminaseTgpA domain-containing protein [Planctomycetaceae bacterium]|jgi:transglutaminase-like putative cysteine protease|nr:transglutaminaseTgpA domain-containing protein [Planctomycetaceae bacterium]
MKLEQYIALHLAFIVWLSSFMLGMGQDDYLFPVITLVGAGVALWLADFKKIFQMGAVLSNVLIILIVLASLGYLAQSMGAQLAVSIVRVLVFVQIVLLFRPKESRTCWNIMSVSFLEVIVASVFTQTVIFGALMFLYLFAGLTVVTLMHLNNDRKYFQRHVFRQTGFQWKWRNLLTRYGWVKIFRALSKDIFSSGIFAFLTKPRRQKNSEIAEPLRFGLSSEQTRYVHWEIPDADRFRRKTIRQTAEPVSRRWSLAQEKAAFSGSAANQSGLIGVGREFYYRLVTGTFLSLAVGGVIFFFTPRQEFRIANLQIQHENWRGDSIASMPGIFNTVGFSQEIRLGSLGTVLSDPSEMMTVQFSEFQDSEKIDREHSGKNYAAIQNQSVYFRGVALPDYERGRWSGADPNPLSRLSSFDPHLNKPRNQKFFDNSSSQESGDFQDQTNFAIDSAVYLERLPAAVPTDERRKFCRFAPDSQLVDVQTRYVTPPSDKILFTVWPYFLAHPRINRSAVYYQDRIVSRPENMIRRGNPVFHYLTYAFRQGRQLELIPCQETIEEPRLLAFREEKLPSVVRLAKQWDTEYQDGDFIARAKNLERRFLTDNRFYYALGGIPRSSSLDPIEDFVELHPGGHCEYFAGTLAMMLRSLGIPSRVIVGYRLDTSAAQMGAQQYVVRQSDAHSWVEAYIPPQQIPAELRTGQYADWWERGGWLRLDPTAPSSEVIAQNGFLENLKYKAASFWNDYIINFNAARQENAIYFPIADFFVSLKDRFFDAEYWKTIGIAALQRYKSIWRDLREGTWQGNDLAILAVSLLIILAICYIIYRILRYLARQILAGSQKIAERQRLATVGFYLRFEKIIQRAGLIRAPNETQWEFAQRTADEIALKWELQMIRQTPAQNAANFSASPTLLPSMVAETFYRVRYGDVALSPVETEAMNTILLRLEKSVPK